MQKFRNTTKICAVLLALLLLFSGCTVPAEISVTTVQTGKNDLADPHAAVVPFTDSLGNEFDTVPETPRVIALYGSFAQCWLLSGGTLVGVTEDAAEEHGIETGSGITLVGSVKEPNLELVASLSPDFVLLSADLTAHLQLDAALSDMGIAHGYFRMDTFADYSTIMQTFCALNDPDGTRYAEYVEKPLDAIERITAETSDALSADPPRVLLLRAYSTGVKAKTNDNLAGVILDELGAHNIAYDAPSLLEELSAEAIIAADPDYIFVSTMGSADAAKAYMLEAVESNPAWAEMSAVKNGRYIFLPKELFHYKPLNRWDESYAYLADCLLKTTA